jgi:hypothetical protein
MNYCTMVVSNEEDQFLSLVCIEIVKYTKKCNLNFIHSFTSTYYVLQKLWFMELFSKVAKVYNITLQYMLLCYI